MTPHFTERFVKSYSKLPQHIQKATDKQIKTLASNPKSRGLNLKKMQDPRGIWEIRITKGYRATFQIEDDFYIFRQVGKHDILKNP